MSKDKDDFSEDDLPPIHTEREVNFKRAKFKKVHFEKVHFERVHFERVQFKEARLLKILVEEKKVVKLLKTIGSEREYPTRELLTKLGAYSYGHKLLLRAQKRGLVDRRTVKNKVFNRLTTDGKKIVKLARAIGI